MSAFPVVFLPGDVVDAEGGEGIVQKLSYAQLKALRDAVGGGDLIARTPDPQARRYEFKEFLKEGLEQYDRRTPLSQINSLSHFKALLEGVLYGHLRVRIYDLQVYKFTLPEHQRYLGVLLNQRGHVLGGTDPDTLFFSAANVMEPDIGELVKANAGTRDTDIGTRAQELFRGFKENLARRSLWCPQDILWMKLLDRLFFEGHEGTTVNLESLRIGWKQVGPVSLWVSVDANKPRYQHFYFPVYEENYRRRALTALSGEVAPVDNGLQLRVKNYSAGKIFKPVPDTVPGQDLLLLGAGNLELQDVPDGVSVRINYEQLRQHIQDIANPLLRNPRAAEIIALDSPFSCPDVIRIPVQYDGFIAIEYLKGISDGRFSELFIERLRGKGVLNPPVLPQDAAPPRLEIHDSGCYFVDEQQGQEIYYIETYNGEQIEELTLLGYVLWCVFDKRATIGTDRSSVAMEGEKILRFTGVRYAPSSKLRADWPDQRQKAATLQRFKGLLARTDMPALFREAIKIWLENAYGSEMIPQGSNPVTERIGPYSIYVDRY